MSESWLENVSHLEVYINYSQGGDSYCLFDSSASRRQNSHRGDCWNDRAQCAHLFLYYFSSSATDYNALLYHVAPISGRWADLDH